MHGHKLDFLSLLLFQVVYKNNDVRLELSRLAKLGDPKMKIHGTVAFKCENVATLDPITFETPESFIILNKWNAKKTGSISFDFRTTEPNGLLLFSHGKPKQQPKDSKSPQTLKVDFFAIEMLDGHLYLLLDMGSGTTKTKAVNKKVNDGEWYHVDFQRDGRSGNFHYIYMQFWKMDHENRQNRHSRGQTLTEVLITSFGNSPTSNI